MSLQENNIDTKEIERKLYESRRFIDGLLPESDEEIRETRQLFGTTPITMPERLRSPRAVLDRIKVSEESKDENSQSLGCVIKVLRTEKRLSLEAVSLKAGIELTVLQSIEDDPQYSPRPLAVSRLAKFFKLSPNKLALLAKLKRKADETQHDAPLQFAACSGKSFDNLTRDQKKVFHQFIKQLRAKH